ncbi:MAG: sialate O-acetylesterase [Alistipes sp.]|nr:sialate O-acetylesterase [Alistipes sp.]
MKRFYALLASLLVAVCGAQAGLRVPQIIGDAMVLQQRCDATLWGWADPGSRITIRTSWSDAPVAVRADAAGRWQAAVATPAASRAPQRVTITDGRTTIVCDDVLIGEVWFCSGQSNMEMPLDGFWNQPVEGANDDIARSGRLAGVRMVTVPHVMASVPQEEVGGAWQRCSPATSPRFSATAFYFARLLDEVLDLPVGIIHCSWGGSTVEGWMPGDLVAGYGDVNLADTTRTGCDDCLRPTVMYNAMLHPLHRYAIRGFLWYQGCSNVGRHETYAARQAAMTARWRALRGSDELPFYFVEIAPYDYGGADAGALLREAQHAAARMIPASGIVSTADLVRPHERGCIHPSRKREVGERLAFLALNRTYGLAGIACDSPTFREMERCDDGSAVLSFDHAESGFAFAGEIEGFEAAGADGRFRPAQARLLFDERRIRVALPDGEPVAAVRYCFRDWAPAQLWSCRGLPLVPFRTDAGR